MQHACIENKYGLVDVRAYLRWQVELRRKLNLKKWLNDV